MFYQMRGISLFYHRQTLVVRRTEYEGSCDSLVRFSNSLAFGNPRASGLGNLTRDSRALSCFVEMLCFVVFCGNVATFKHISRHTILDPWHRKLLCASACGALLGGGLAFVCSQFGHFSF